MGWNRAIKPTKGLLAGTIWTYGDIGTTLTFSDYTADYNAIPLTGVQAEKPPVEFQGYRFNMPNLLEDFLSGQTSANNVLLAAFNVNPQGGQSGAYLCFIMDVSQYTHSGNENWCRLRLRVSKRLYDYAGTSYTETWPMGDTALDGEFFFSSDAVTDPYRKGPDFVIFLKTATYSGVDNIVVGWAHAMDGGYAECYLANMAYRMKKSFFNSSSGWGSDANVPSGEVESPEFGPAAQPGGGYNESSEHKGSFDNSSDQITLSSMPTTSVLGTNMVHAYKVNDTILNQFADAMYPDYVFSNTSIEDALAGIYNAIFFSKYVDFMLDLVILPIDVPAPHTVHIKVGGKYVKTATEAFIDAPMVQQQYVEVDLGTLAIEEYWANFLDFAGTRVKLFLPYVGFVDIQPEYVIGGEIGVKYRFNVLDGSFMAYVRSTSGHSELEESLIAQYSGVAAVHIPLQAADYSQKVSGLISAIGGVAAGVAGSGVMGAIAAHGVANAANTLIQKPGSSHANGYNASSSFLSHRKPYLIIERQTSQFSEKYPEEVGLPLNVAMRLGDCEGLTVASTAHLDTIPATKEEKNLIGQYLKEGIII